MGAVLLVGKMIFGAIGNVFGKILSDWRILVLVCVLVVGGMVGMKIRADQKQLAEVKTELVQEKKNNETLRENVSILQETNQANQDVIKQLQAEKQLALDSVKKLNDQSRQATTAFNTIQSQLEEIKTPPTKLTPYISYKFTNFIFESYQISASVGGGPVTESISIAYETYGFKDWEHNLSFSYSLVSKTFGAY